MIFKKWDVVHVIQLVGVTTHVKQFELQEILHLLLVVSKYYPVGQVIHSELLLSIKDGN